jgi:hypothetical protein
MDEDDERPILNVFGPMRRAAEAVLRAAPVRN